MIKQSFPGWQVFGIAAERTNEYAFKTRSIRCYDKIKSHNTPMGCLLKRWFKEF